MILIIYLQTNGYVEKKKPTIFYQSNFTLTNLVHSIDHTFSIDKPSNICINKHSGELTIEKIDSHMKEII